MESSITFLPATIDMMTRFYGQRPQKTFYAFAIVRGEEILGVSGFYFCETYIVFFSDLTDEARNHARISLVKSLYQLLNTAKGFMLPIYARCDPDIEKADKLLNHFGFFPITDEIYQCN